MPDFTWKVLGEGDCITGPTSLRDLDQGLGGTFVGGEEWPHATIISGMDTVAVVPAPEKEPHTPPGQFPNGPDIEVMEARVRLIAAAPELLEAAKKALLFLDPLGPPPAKVHATAVFQSAFSAVSKAEGKDPVVLQPWPEE